MLPREARQMEMCLTCSVCVFLQKRISVNRVSLPSSQQVRCLQGKSFPKHVFMMDGWNWELANECLKNCMTTVEEGFQPLPCSCESWCCWLQSRAYQHLGALQKPTVLAPRGWIPRSVGLKAGTSNKVMLLDLVKGPSLRVFKRKEKWKLKYPHTLILRGRPHVYLGISWWVASSWL